MSTNAPESSRIGALLQQAAEAPTGVGFPAASTAKRRKRQAIINPEEGQITQQGAGTAMIGY